MQVYKAYFKIIRRNLPEISLYLGIFLLITILVVRLGGDQSGPELGRARINIAYINYDKGAVLADHLGDYLQEHANIIDISDDRESLQDALFFGKIKYVVKVPAGFSQSILSGRNDVKLEKTSIESSASSVYLDFLINRYLSTASLYSRNMSGLNDAQLLSLVTATVNQHSDLEVKTYPNPVSNLAKNFYILLVYGMLFAIFLGVTSFMLVFNHPDIKKRNLGSPLKRLNMNMQIVLGNLTYSMAVWLIMVGLSLLMLRGAAFNIHSVLLYVNSLCLTLVCLSISYLAGIFMQNLQVRSAVANVLGLGLCFISGVFVPQAFLGQTVSFIASFTPTFWYVKAVNDIEKLVLVNAANITPIINSMLIQLGFVAALLAVALAVSRYKQKVSGPILD